jgi:hypothetical protein
MRNWEDDMVGEMYLCGDCRAERKHKRLCCASVVQSRLFSSALIHSPIEKFVWRCKKYIFAIVVASLGYVYVFGAVESIKVRDFASTTLQTNEFFNYRICQRANWYVQVMVQYSRAEEKIIIPRLRHADVTLTLAALPRVLVTPRRLGMRRLADHQHCLVLHCRHTYCISSFS